MRFGVTPGTCTIGHAMSNTPLGSRLIEPGFPETQWDRGRWPTVRFSAFKSASPSGGPGGGEPPPVGPTPLKSPLAFRSDRTPKSINGNPALLVQLVANALDQVLAQLCLIRGANLDDLLLVHHMNAGRRRCPVNQPT